ncbi:TPA: hypothetical protein ACKPYB_000390 [Stenotrophomonas maltophilia]|uniref:hypothetical protein n=1 Tax=Stenotrophomonas TaxID=40323 RepID=UPI001AA198A2|nr:MULTISPECIES: hypothetical protein [Stenotrophomonas]ELF4107292.1 hypothetical protein [Stenotrophomonas maltophilia]MBO1742915.1 hypothetical protein [Stenotrophomonas maltophilia]WAP03103.1 hypothetical protein FQS62_006305 [Stenotrophomonas sp. SBJS02]
MTVFLVVVLFELAMFAITFGIAWLCASKARSARRGWEAFQAGRQDAPSAAALLWRLALFYACLALLAYQLQHVVTGVWLDPSNPYLPSSLALVVYSMTCGLLQGSGLARRRA